MINSNFLATAKASVARELDRCFAPAQDDSKISNFLAQAKALVARNSRGALLILKGTVK